MLEYCYKDDELGDPMVNEYHIAAMGWASDETMKQIAAYALKINDLLVRYFKPLNIDLIDFKIEVGFDKDGNVFVVDEITPDIWRVKDENGVIPNQIDCAKMILEKIR